MSLTRMNGVDEVVFLVTVAATLFIYFRNKSRHALPYPPGPKKHLFLGSLLDLPRNYPWETYARWAEEVDSDIIHFHAARKHFIVLNSFKAATDLLDKKSAIYSNRPQYTMKNELMGWSWVFSSMPYGKPWRERRRMFQQYFSNRSGHVYRNHQVKFVRKALFRLLDHPTEFFDVVHHMTGGVAISLAYGLNVQDNRDPFVEFSQHAFQAVLDATLPGGFLVDVMPWLKYVPEWVPGAGFQKTAKTVRKLQEGFRESPFAEALKSLAAGTAQPSLMSHLLEQYDTACDSERSQEVIKDVAGIVFAGANDTTIAALETFFAAMLLFPEVQKKAQDELDAVLQGQLPEFRDEPNLPYVSAIVKELLRWKPVAPLGLPHQLTEDDVYNGYHVPKGSFVLANAWAMLHDEVVYPDPSTFKPERFLTRDGRLDPAVRDPSLIAFGFGRRICPGSHVALSMLWLWAASFLATYSISPAIDEEGASVEPSIEYESSSITFHPLPFKCTIKPRSDLSEELIRAQVLPGA